MLRILTGPSQSSHHHRQSASGGEISGDKFRAGMDRVGHMPVIQGCHCSRYVMRVIHGSTHRTRPWQPGVLGSNSHGFRRFAPGAIRNIQNSYHHSYGPEAQQCTLCRSQKASWPFPDFTWLSTEIFAPLSLGRRPDAMVGLHWTIG